MGEKLLYGYGKHTSRFPQHHAEMHKEESRTPSVEEVTSFLEEHIARDSILLNSAPVLTDTNMDITETIRGRMIAYKEVKSYIERGKKG